MDDGVRDRHHPYRQCVSEVNAWLIVWLFLFIVYKVVTKVEVGGLKLLRAGGNVTQYWWCASGSTQHRAVYSFVCGHTLTPSMKIIRETMWRGNGEENRGEERATVVGSTCLVSG
jgi:hypothetical protein